MRQARGRVRRHAGPFFDYWCREPDTSAWKWAYTLSVMVMVGGMVAAPTVGIFLLTVLPVPLLVIAWTLHCARTYVKKRGDVNGERQAG